jgi:hypothetical protein
VDAIVWRAISIHMAASRTFTEVRRRLLLRACAELWCGHSVGRRRLRRSNSAWWCSIRASSVSGCWGECM